MFPLGLFFVGIVAFGVHMLAHELSTRSWPTVEGRVLRSDVNRRTSWWGTVDFEYEDTVDGTVYRSNVFDEGPASGEFMKQEPLDHAAALVSTYPQHAMVTVYHDPANPAQARLVRPPLTLGGLGFVGMGIFFLSMFIPGLVNVWRRRVRATAIFEEVNTAELAEGLEKCARNPATNRITGVETIVAPGMILAAVLFMIPACVAPISIADRCLYLALPGSLLIAPAVVMLVPSLRRRLAALLAPLFRSGSLN